MSNPSEIVFGHTVEGLLLALKGRLEGPSPLRAKLKDAGLDLDRKLEPAYPNSVWQKLLQIGATELFPNVPMNEAQWLLGERFVAGYFETNMGRALQAVLRLLGPARVLDRMSRNLASGSNFLHVDVERLADTDYRVRVNEGGTYPEFIGSICHHGMLTTGVKGLTTVVESRQGRAAIYRVRW